MSSVPASYASRGIDYVKPKDRVLVFWLGTWQLASVVKICDSEVEFDLRDTSQSGSWGAICLRSARLLTIDDAEQTQKAAWNDLLAWIAPAAERGGFSPETYLYSLSTFLACNRLPESASV